MEKGHMGMEGVDPVMMAIWNKADDATKKTWTLRMLDGKIMMKEVMVKHLQFKDRDHEDAEVEDREDVINSRPSFLVREFAPDGLDAALAFTNSDDPMKAMKAVKKGGPFAFHNGVEPEPKVSPGFMSMRSMVFRAPRFSSGSTA